MDTSELILSILGTLPDHKIVGKKRLQKLVYLLIEAGAPCQAHYALKDFGPYSGEVERQTSLLSIIGLIEERDVQVGYANYLATAYTIPEPAFDAPKLKGNLQQCLTCLNDYSTVELEIASTIRFFNKTTDLETAINMTADMKPSKAKPEVIKNALAALECIG